jgi:hypothetical protein
MVFGKLVKLSMTEETVSEIDMTECRTFSALAELAAILVAQISYILKLICRERKSVSISVVE